MFYTKSLIVMALFLQMSCLGSEQGIRASRPDALSYPGSTPEIVSAFGSVTALLAQIKQCVCNLQSALATCCEQINSRLEVIEGNSCCEQINSRLEIIEQLDQSCCEQTQSRLDIIVSSLDSLSDCGAIAISAPATITEPGSYCLQNNSTDTITISASNVALNLNNHALGAVNIGAVNNVHVSNGFIEGGGGISINAANNIELSYLQINGTTSNGITINNASSAVAVHDVIISTPAANGIELAGGSFNITIKDVLVTGAALTGIDFASAPGARDVFIESTAVYNSGARGFRLGDGASIINCVAAYNSGNGIRFQAANSPGPVSPSMYAQDCITMNNDDDGVHIIGGRITLVNVVAVGNGVDAVSTERNGFYVTSSAVLTFEGCVAESNATNGFLIDDDPASTGTIRGCSAINNGSFGFNDPAGAASTITYINNIASRNNGNAANENYNIAAGLHPFYSQNYTLVQNGTEDSSYWRNLAAPTTP